MSKEIQRILLEQAGASVDETAVVLGLSPAGVRLGIKRGDIPAKRIGPTILRVPTSWLRSTLAVEANRLKQNPSRADTRLRGREATR